jgi:cyclopropane-fatty-acyl-phospholipid synthase
MTTIAEDLASVARSVIGTDIPVRLRAWDGSETGPEAGPILGDSRFPLTADWLA